jgi:hypothetical protein
MLKIKIIELSWPAHFALYARAESVVFSHPTIHIIFVIAFFGKKNIAHGYAKLIVEHSINLCDKTSIHACEKLPDFRIEDAHCSDLSVLQIFNDVHGFFECNFCCGVEIGQLQILQFCV